MGEKGLNLAKKVDELDPGEAAVANNVETYASAIAKRKGYRLALTGSYDKVIKGGPSSMSIGVVGEERWLDQPRNMISAFFTEASPEVPGEVDGRRDFFNQRPSMIVIPEGPLTAIRLNVRDADPSWAIEFCVRADEIPLIRGSTLSTSPIIVPIPIQKGMGTSGQWAVRFIQDTTSDRFYATLTLYEGSALGTAGAVGNPITPTANATDFFYNSGANRAWIEPGKRIWLAWKFIKGAPGNITSYYWIEGATSAVSSTQTSDYLHATLRTNGVGGSTYPMTVGRRPYQAAGRLGVAGASANNVIDEVGFLGTNPELRFWLDSAQGAAGTLELPANWAVVSASPPAVTDWYVEREIPQEQLTLDSTVENANLVQTSDLQLYFQFKPELIGRDILGNAIAGENHRIIRPRFTRGTASDHASWISGSDVTWLTAAAPLGPTCLGLVPAAQAASQKYVFADAARSGKTDSYPGKRLFCGAIRIPNASLYVRRSSAAGANYEWPDEFSFRVPVRCDALPSSTTYQETILELNVVRQGTAVNFDRYGTSSILRLALAFNGANWVARLIMRDGTGAASANVDSATTIVEGTTYVLGVSTKFEQGNRILSLFVNGAREATNSVAATKPWMSQPSNTDSTDPNRDDDDGRDASFPFFIGCSVETPINVDSHPDPFLFRYGAYGIGGGAEIGRLGANRAYWGWGTNDTPRTINDGIGYRGHNPFVGAVGGIQVWQRYLSESEMRALATRGPSGEEMQRDGAKLLSNWTFSEGEGVLAEDSGYLKNHLKINPFPTAFIAQGACDRYEKPALLGVWQKRQLSTLGTPTSEVYALSHGTINLLEKNGGLSLLRGIGRCKTPEMWNPTSRTPRLPTAFQFSGALNICSGLGPPKRVIDGKVSDLGLTPVFGEPGTDQTNLGWREFDRDGTFQVYLLAAAASAAETIFVPNRKYGWCITYYDPDSGLESAPSRLMFLKINPAWGANGAKAMLLTSFPKSPQTQAGRIRIYRTPADSGVFRLVAEMSSDTTSFSDAVPELKLGEVMSSWLNYPPPQNARIGMAFGDRALYFGVPEHPDTLYYAMQGEPGAVPVQYQLTIASGQSTEIVAGVVINDRCFIFTRTATFAVFDAGGDIAIDAQDLPPVQLYQLRDDIGCVSHHGIITIEGFGAIIPSEQGLFLFDGQNFKNLGGVPNDRIKPFWQQLNMEVSRNFVAAAHRRKKQYILFCSTSCSPDGANDRALVYDWGNDTFVIQTQREVLNAALVIDETTGLERVWCTTLTGEVFEFDPPDADLNSDGPTVAPFNGLIISAKKDPLGTGTYTRLQLVSDNSLSTAGNGLRGVNLYVTNAGVQWHFRPLKVLWNDANFVLVKGDPGTTNPTGFEWRLGAIASHWLSGKFNVGSDVMNLRVLRAQFNLNPSSGSQLVTQCFYDEIGDTAKFSDPSMQFAILAGISGRGKRFSIRLHDITRFGGLPENNWSVARMEIHVQPRGRSTYVPS